jgi:DNA-binding NarL/FixJ family response regulator
LRILLADDHDIVRRGVRTLVESRRGWRVVGEANDGRRAVELAARLRPDVAILDVSMAGMGGIEATRLIREHAPGTAVLLLTVYESPELLRQAAAAGARGYVAKGDGARALLGAVGAVARGGAFVTPRVAGAGRSRPLTAREREVLCLLAGGLRSREVAAALGMREKTVETHRSSLLRKLRLRGLAELVRYAMRNGLVEG